MDARETDYEAIYRKTHPRAFLFSPWERQMELRDLWPSLQTEFRDGVDAMLAAAQEQEEG